MSKIQIVGKDDLLVFFCLGHNIHVLCLGQAEITNMSTFMPRFLQPFSQRARQVHVEEKFHEALASSRGTIFSSMAQAAYIKA